MEKRILYRNKLKNHGKSLAKCLGTYVTNIDRKKSEGEEEGKECGKKEKKGK